MKTKIKSLFLFIFIFIFIISFQKSIYLNNFNVNEVNNNIKYLSSDRFKGRMAGTFENEVAASYIRSEFKKNGLQPYTEDYYQNFSVTFPKLISACPFLKVIDNTGKVIKQYTYGVDYKEDMLSFNQNRIAFTKNSYLTCTDRYIKVCSADKIYVFYCPENNNLSFRSSYTADSKISMLILVSRETLNDIENSINAGNSIDCFIPYTQSKANINNVIGYIKGKNPNLAPIVISAHFDHVGVDFSNNVYNGALDNASGISFVIEMSKYIKSIGTPDRNIIFVAFNAEEFGLLGSSYFANYYRDSLKNSLVFNFDMIGSSNVPLSLVGGKKDNKNTPIIKCLSKICSNNKIKYNCLFEDASDHSSFRKLGIEAITFCNSDMTKIHTPSDKSQFISTDAIKKCFTVSSIEILSLAFRDNYFILYCKQIWIVSLGISIILGINLIVTFRKKYY